MSLIQKDSMASASATSPIPVVITDPISGAQANVQVGDNNGLKTSGLGQTLTLALASTQAANTPFPITAGGAGLNPNGQTYIDMAGYAGFSISLGATALSASGSVLVRTSNDPAMGIWQAAVLNSTSSTASSSTGITTTAQTYQCAPGVRFIQLQCGTSQPTGAGNVTTAFVHLLSQVPVPATPTVGISGTPSIVGSRPFEAYATITRPANTTTYTAGQVLSSATSGLVSFPSLNPGIGASQRFIITNVALISSNGAAVTPGQFALELFNVSNPSGGGFNDGATYAVTAAAQASTGNAIIGSLGTTVTAGQGTASYMYTLQGLNIQCQTPAGGNVYMAVVVLNAYVPASAETITVKIAGVY